MGLLGDIWDAGTGAVSDAVNWTIDTGKDAIGAVGDAITVDQHTAAQEEAKRRQQEETDRLKNIASQPIVRDVPNVSAPGQATTATANAPQAGLTTARNPMEVTAPTIAGGTVERTTLNTGPQDQIRSAQTNLITGLEAAAAGTGGPSAAEALLKRATDRNISQQYGIAAGLQGRSTGGALRGAQTQIGNLNAQAAADAAILRAKEQQGAQQLLAGTLSGVRGQDLSLATEEGRIKAQENLANLDAQIKVALANGNNQLAADLANQKSQLQTDLTNASNANDMAKANALLSADVSKFNASQINEMEALRQRLQLQADQGNQQAALMLQQLNDQLELGRNKLVLTGLANEGALATGIDTGALTADQGNQRLFGDVVSAAGPIIAGLL